MSGGKTEDNTEHAHFSIKIKTRDGFFCFCFTYVFRASGHLKIILAKEQQYLLFIFSRECVIEMHTKCLVLHTCICMYHYVYCVCVMFLFFFFFFVKSTFASKRRRKFFGRSSRKKISFRWRKRIFNEKFLISFFWVV